MIVTKLSPQIKDPNRINIFLDGKYRFSLSIEQVVDLGVKIGLEYGESDVAKLRQSSDFGKLYGRALEYSLVRPRSKREMEQYLFRKTLDRLTKDGVKVAGYSKQTADDVLWRLIDRGYISDSRFAQFWVESRHLKKGISQRKLRAELMAKGVASSVVDEVLSDSERSDKDELKKVIEKNARRYSDRRKFMAYLAGRGFSYNDIQLALDEELVDESP